MKGAKFQYGEKAVGMSLTAWDQIFAEEKLFLITAAAATSKASGPTTDSCESRELDPIRRPTFPHRAFVQIHQRFALSDQGADPGSGQRNPAGQEGRPQHSQRAKRWKIGKKRPTDERTNSLSEAFFACPTRPTRPTLRGQPLPYTVDLPINSSIRLL